MLIGRSLTASPIGPGLSDTPGVERHVELAAKTFLAVGIGFAVSDKNDTGQSGYLRKRDCEIILAGKELGDNLAFCILQKPFRL